MKYVIFDLTANYIPHLEKRTFSLVEVDAGIKLRIF